MNKCDVMLCEIIVNYWNDADTDADKICNPTNQRPNYMPPFMSNFLFSLYDYIFSRRR